MKKNILFIPLLILFVILAGACSRECGYRINGFAEDSQFEGKTVYVTDVQSNSIRYDSTVVQGGRFQFSDSVDVALPYVRILSIQADSIMPYCLPVVIENGQITAKLGDLVCTSGTNLNDKLQDFLLGLDQFIASISKHKEWSAEDVKSNFADYFVEHISANANNVVGVYIYEVYCSNIPDEKRQFLLEKNQWLKEQVKE